jgi:radical SAM protein with 4Fe4S-binding SPASM domain
MLRLIQFAKNAEVSLIRTADPLIKLLDSNIMRGELKGGECPAAKKMCYLDAEGNVSPCSMGADFCGNIRDAPLKEILESNAFSEKILKNKCTVPNCSFAAICRGGCYLRHINGVDQKCWTRERYAKIKA